MYVTIPWNNPNPWERRSTFSALLFHGCIVSPRSSRSCSPTSFFWWPARAQHIPPMLGPNSHVHIAHIWALFTAVPSPHMAAQGHERDVGSGTSPLCLTHSCLDEDLRTPMDLPHFPGIWVNVIVQHRFAMLLPKPSGSLESAGVVS